MPRTGAHPRVRPAAPRARDSVADVGRAFLVFAAVVSALLGLVLLLAAGVVGLAFGPDGTLATSPTLVHSDGVAVLLDDLQVRADSVPVPEGIGALTLKATSPDGAAVFLGAGPRADVDTYLTGAPYSVVVDGLPAGGTATTRDVPGTQQPPIPAPQAFWGSASEGATARIPARVDDGTTVVVMAADAHPGVTVLVSASLVVDRAWPAALIAAGAGVVLLVLCVLLIVLARRRRPAPSGAHRAGAHAVAATVLPGVVPAEPVASPPVDPAPVDDPDPDLVPSNPSDADEGLVPPRAEDSTPGD